MAELLLELFSEEIPSGMQLKALEQLKTALSTRFDSDGIAYGDISGYATPRRLVLVVDGLEKKQSDSVEEKRGPRADAPANAIEGFVKSVGMKLEELEKRNTDKGEFYFAVIRKKGRDVAVCLVEILQEILYSFTWPKSMKWGQNNIRWIRPLHNILCLFDGDVLPVTFGHLSANNHSRGHRFLSEGAFEVTNFKDYEQKLHDNFVVLDSKKRKEIIENESSALAKLFGLTVKRDEGLLDEVTGLVEWPVVLLGRIEEKFMSVPKEVLITAMRSHQKYFSLLNAKGELAHYFLTVSNMKSEDKGAKIISGNERVLRARLEDAKFFWDKDRRISLESRVDDLNKVVFHAKLGTVAEKVTRMTELAKLLSVWIPHANLVLAERAAKLSKADLTTEMVGEFPELQGLMGSYYAIESKEDQSVADAIKDHYSPMGPNDDCPKAPLSIAVALADKIDTLMGLFAVDEKPTGSKDPYALRRAALGILRIMLENNLRIPMKLLFEKAITKYPKSLLKSPKKPGKLLSIGGDKADKPKARQEKLISELLEFLAERLRFLLKAQSVRPDLINAVFDGGLEDDFNRLVHRVKTLDAFLSTEDGVNLSAAYKRATNIVLAEEKKHNTHYEGEPDRGLLELPEERELYELFAEIIPVIESSLKGDDFATVMKELARLRQPLDRFFDKVIVNSDDEAVRKNRLLLLSQFRAFLNQVANFSVIEG